MISDDSMLAIAGSVAKVFELAGIGVIVLGALYAVGIFVAAAATGDKRGGRDDDPIAVFRRILGRAILTGLELLVAADIIRTVAIDPTLDSVLVLGLIVLIRTFLSFSLEVEIDGRWPWQQASNGQGEDEGER